MPVENNENLESHIHERTREHLRVALYALYGHDQKLAQRELEWVEDNLDADPTMPLVAFYLREIVDCS